MGMSASQARLLSLQARMTDVEYEGQQINQQRLMLSNKMNEVMEKMTNMDVPTPPSKQDFLYNTYKGKTRNGKTVNATMNDDGTFNFTKPVTGNIVVDGGLMDITKGAEIKGSKADIPSTTSDSYHKCEPGEDGISLKGVYHDLHQYQPENYKQAYGKEYNAANKKFDKPLTSAYTGGEGTTYATKKSETKIQIPVYTDTKLKPSGYYAGGKYSGKYFESEPVKTTQTRYVLNGEEVSSDTEGATEETTYYLNNEECNKADYDATYSPLHEAHKLEVKYTNVSITFPISSTDLETLITNTQTQYDTDLNGYKNDGTKKYVSSGNADDNPINFDNFVTSFEDLYTIAYDEFAGLENTPATAFDSTATYWRFQPDETGDGYNKTKKGSDLVKHNNEVQANYSKDYYIEDGNGGYKKVKGSVAKDYTAYEEGEGDIKITNKEIDVQSLEGYYIYDNQNLAYYIGAGGKTAEEAKALLRSGGWGLMKKSNSGDIRCSDANFASGASVGGNPTMTIAEAKAKYGGEPKFSTALSGLKQSFGEDCVNEWSVIISTSDTGTLSFSFCKTIDLATGSGVGTEKNLGQVRVYNPTVGEYEETIENVEVAYDEGGYLKNIKLPNGEIVNLEIVQQVDETKYSIAMNKYEIEKIEYDKEVNELNKQTSIYQRQDKQLELKLTRLDTERNALNTEIDAVKKVIQDATEKGFKTFSG